MAAFWSPGGVPHAPGRVAIIDWGNTERLNEDYILPFSYQLQTESYRSPETIAGAGASPGTDLWSVGCMVWDLAVGKALFRPASDAPWGRAVDHLALMADVLGTPDHTFPSWFLTAGSRAGDLFEPPPGVSMEIWRNATTAAADPAAAAAPPPPPPPLEDGTPPPTPRLRGIGGHSHTSVAELLAAATDYHPAVRAALTDFLTATLQLDPNARPPAGTLLTTSELLTREWTDEEVGVPPSPAPPSPPPKRRRLGHWEGRGGWVAVQLRTLLNVGWGGKVAGAATASAVTGR